MDEFGWASVNSDVHRRLTIDRRNYDVVAFYGGDGLVGVRVTGWDGGSLVTEMVGELPATDAFEVGTLIAAALSGFRELATRTETVPTRPAEDWWSPPWASAPNAGKPWEPQDLEMLLARFQEGASVKSLTAELGRTEGGIRSRLQLLGATRQTPSPPEDVGTEGPPTGLEDGRSADQPPTGLGWQERPPVAG
jgi:hypothetical protein